MYACPPDCSVLAKAQAVFAIANQKWGSFEGLQRQRAEAMSRRFEAIEAAKHRAEHWESSAEGQAKVAHEAKHSEEAAAGYSGGSDRRKLMVASLAARGLRLQLDWEQCTDYIRTGVGDPERLADTMAALKWLYDNTDFPSRIQVVSLSRNCAHEAV